MQPRSTNVSIPVKKFANHMRSDVTSELIFKNLNMTIFSNIVSWCFDGGETSLPIPNRAIKPTSTDDSPSGRK